MVWPLIAMGAMSILGNIQQNRSAKKQTKQQNKAIQEANTKNMQATMFKAGMLNVQMADQKKILTQRRADLTRDELATASVSANNAAASGTIGASVDAVQSDVAAQFDRAQAEIKEENLRNLDNYNMALHDIFWEGQMSIRSTVKPNMISGGEMLLNAGITAGTAYAQSRMSLGLGGGGGGQAVKA